MVIAVLRFLLAEPKHASWDDVIARRIQELPSVSGSSILCIVQYYKPVLPCVAMRVTQDSFGISMRLISQ